MPLCKVLSSSNLSPSLVQIGDNVLEITELPVRKWTQDYKEFLESMVKPENKDEVCTVRAAFWLHQVVPE